MKDDKLKQMIQNNKRDEIIRVIERAYKNKSGYVHHFNNESLFSSIVAKYDSNEIILELDVKSQHCDSKNLISNIGKNEDYKALFDSLKNMTTLSKNEIYDLMKNQSTLISDSIYYDYKIIIPMYKVDCEK